jgi:serine/threonine protein phosphatase 1
MVEPRVWAVGDIHGCLTAFAALIAALELAAADRLVTLGDYVDRGPATRPLLDRLIALHESGILTPLRGNHELMMLRARDGMGEERFWREHGGDAALASYAPPDRPGRLADVPDRHWRFLAAHCRDFHETDRQIFVHAGLSPRRPADDQDEYDLFWRPLDDRGPHASGKLVVCGHTAQPLGRPKSLGHTICIDTGACHGGWLTALDVATLDYVQANEAGDVRWDRVVPP